MHLKKVLSTNREKKGEGNIRTSMGRSIQAGCPQHSSKTNESKQKTVLLVHPMPQPEVMGTSRLLRPVCTGNSGVDNKLLAGAIALDGAARSGEIFSDELEGRKFANLERDSNSRDVRAAKG